DLGTAFAALIERRVAALVVVPDALFVGQREQLATLAARHAIPTIYSNRAYADAGGLMSYGASQLDAYRQAGKYVGRILSGGKPVRTLHLQVPDKLLALADEVIE